MMFGSAPKYCQTVPGRQYLPGINFDSARGPNHINSVQVNSPAHKLGIKAGERVPSIDGRHVSNYADIRKVLPDPLASNRPVTISTDRNTYVITPGLARVEQCYWDTRDGTMSEIENGEVSSQGPQQRSFRATCRIVEGYVTACSRGLQDSSTNM
jgi:membrane-associated protease RseP (regulator of RpoE activity)